LRVPAPGQPGHARCSALHEPRARQARPGLANGRRDARTTATGGDPRPFAWAARQEGPRPLRSHYFAGLRKAGVPVEW